MRRRPPSTTLLAVALLLASPTFSAAQDARPAPPPTSLFDPRLAGLRTASATWEARLAPRRVVIDQVCLVPDFATFLAAVSTWDRRQCFPVLLDDTEHALKFLRAFRPSRVIRYPQAVAAIPPDRRWEAAREALGRAWAEPGERGKAPPSGSRVPEAITSPPPGVVVSSPESPLLAAAVALAAGRFQPLVRWEPGKTSADTLGEAEATQLVFNLEARVIDAAPKHDRLGDDCDFITLAGDYPYRSTLESVPQQVRGAACFDDAVARARDGGGRWAYVGRLVGDEAEGIYQAMCSLFLQPESALLFNAYSEKGEPWSDYAMGKAARRLTGRVPVELVSAPNGADLRTWHEAFDPINRHGLVLINTSGDPTSFNLAGGPGQTADIPRTVPAAVLAIHSFSAANPADASTLAGRWLTNGAFFYFGSMNEPYLQAFRTSTLVADLIVEGLPLVAAARMVPGEMFGFPWRLIAVGDPLYRLEPKGVRPRRVEPPAAPAWPTYREARAPGTEADDAQKLGWALRTAIARAGRKNPPAGDIVAALQSIRRDALAPAAGPTYDALLADILWLGKRDDLARCLAAIDGDDGVADRRRWLETALTAEVQAALRQKRADQAAGAWALLAGTDVSMDLKSLLLKRIGAAARTPVERRAWARQLAEVAGRTEPGRLADEVQAELRRIEGDPAGPGG